jgi:hypothetical protein
VTNYAENRFSMYRAVCALLKENEGQFSGIPGLSQALKELDKTCSLIIETDNRYKYIAKGATDAKRNAQHELVESILKTGGVMFVAGKKDENDNLKKISDVTYSGLNKMRDTELLGKGRIIFENAKTYQDRLKTINSDIEAEIAELEKHLTDFDKTLNSRDTKTSESHTAHQELETILDKADDIVNDEIDNLMEGLKTKNSTLFNDYHRTRLIKDLGIRAAKKEEEKKS